jgi:hypothetical protein
MRKALPVVALIFTLGMALAPAAAARATTSVDNKTVPIHTQLFGDCVGVLDINGTEHLLNVFTIDSAGRVHIQHMDSYRFTGTRLEAGDQYRATSVSRFNTTAQLGQPPFVVTDVVAEHLISPTAPDLLVHLLFHTTINPDGTVGHGVAR